MNDYIYSWVKSLYHYIDQHGFDPDLSLLEVHSEGLASLVIKRKEDGGLIRLFYTERGLNRGDLQLHTHKYGITITPLTLGVVNVAAINSAEEGAISISRMIYHSVVDSKYTNKGVVDTQPPVSLKLHETHLPLGCQVNLTADDAHTVIADRGCCWIIEEHPVQGKDYNTVFGVPFEPYPTVPARSDMEEFKWISRSVKQIFKNYLAIWEQQR